MFHEPWEQSNGVYSVLPKAPLGVTALHNREGGGIDGTPQLSPQLE